MPTLRPFFSNPFSICICSKCVDGVVERVQKPWTHLNIPVPVCQRWMGRREIQSRRVSPRPTLKKIPTHTHETKRNRTETMKSGKPPLFVFYTQMKSWHQHFPSILLNNSFFTITTLFHFRWILSKTRFVNIKLLNHVALGLEFEKSNFSLFLFPFGNTSWMFCLVIWS